jgi:flavin reductase (DIM6/NTAB) family NADH-FMN oxidoreductase RutF
LWERAEAVAVHVLAENQRDLSNRFARALTNKWEGMRVDECMGGAPLLPGVAAVFECAVSARHEGGDHTLFILAVERFRSFADRKPLVFGKGRYAELQPSDIAAPLWPLDIHY